MRIALTSRPTSSVSPDLLNACDAAISKPGYGLVAEIIANQTRLLYTSRSDFVEYEVLAKGLKEYAVTRELSREDFFAGQEAVPPNVENL